MNTNWYLNDLIDLEYFLHIDAGKNAQARWQDVEVRDRDIFLKSIEPRLYRTKPYPRRLIIKSWLDRRREMEIKPSNAKSVLPGVVFAEALRLLGYGLFILGGLTGITLAFSLLTYTGSAPLNVSVYLGATVLVQILLLFLLGGLFLIRLIRPRLFYRSVIFSVLSRLAITLAGKFKQRIGTSFSSTQREGMSAVFGLVRGKQQVYGSLFYWPIFNLAQLFGIGFNSGILGATLLRVIGTDMAFGWQSTLQVSATAVHAIVKWMAIPWSWLVPPGLAHPTLSQIEGSRLVLKDGIYHLVTPDLVAWWPFLCFAVLFYGLLPRIVIFFLGSVTQRYLVDRVAFTHAACDQLVDRMTLPRIRFGTPEGTWPHTAVPVSSEEPPIDIKDRDIEKKFLVLIPDDIFESCLDKNLKPVLKQTLGGDIVEKIRIEPAGPDEVIALDRLISVDSENAWSHVLILQEAWQPPIIETIAFLKALRHRLGERTPIIVGLIGKPEPDTIFTPVSSINWRTWREKLATLGDPYLRQERVVHGNA